MTTTPRWPRSRGSGGSRGASTIRISRAPRTWPSRGSCRSWTTSMARCEAAATARDGFRERNEPFLGWAALTVGLLEMTLGRHDCRAGVAHRGRASSAGGSGTTGWSRVHGRSSPRWPRGRVASTRLERCWWRRCTASGDAELSTQAADLLARGLRTARAGRRRGRARRAGPGCGRWAAAARGLRAWPSMRGDEAELAARVARELDPAAFEGAFAAGSRFSSTRRGRPGARRRPASGVR